MESEKTNLERRRFHLAVIYGLGAVIGLALAAPAAIYLLFPPRSRKKQEWAEAADISLLPPNTPEEIIFRKNRVDGWKVSSEKTSAWVVKKSNNEVVAFAPQCTHLGCAFRWDDRRRTFLCPCHSSNFDLDGNVLDGPAPRPLDRYEVKLEGAKLLLGDVAKSTD